ncbi:MAG: TolC family protein, partial [Rubrivivax sp.]
MSSRPAIAALLLASVTAGCAVGPTYSRPGVAIPDKFQGQAEVDDRAAVGNADLAEWWVGFNDTDLTRLVRLALQQNLDLVQATARVAQARAALGTANAALLPSGRAGAQGARAYQSVETPLGRVLDANPGFDRLGSAYEANASAGWELDLFGGLRRGAEAAQADHQASQAGAVAVRLAVAAQTADIYVSIRGLQARLAIAHRQAETAQALLDKVRLLQGKGLAADLQVQQVEAAVAQVRASIPVLRAALSTAMNALDVLLGAAPGTYSAALADGGAIPIPTAPRIGATGSPAELLRRRPDLITAERRLAASNARIGVAVAEYYPKVSLSGLIGSATSVSSGNLFTGGASQAAGVLGLRWRLFDFGRIDAQIEQARGQQAELLAAYRLAVLRATEDVENAFSALVNREAQGAELAKGVESLTRARAATFAAHQRGVVSMIEVLQA